MVKTVEEIREDRQLLELPNASAGRETGLALVDAADLRTVLNQQQLHCHWVPGRWDSDGRACVECAARTRLHNVLDQLGGPAS